MGETDRGFPIPLGVIIAKNMKKAVESIGGKLGEFDNFHTVYETHGAWEIEFDFDQLVDDQRWEKYGNSFVFKRGIIYIEDRGSGGFGVSFDEEKRMTNKYWIQLTPLLS